MIIIKSHIFNFLSILFSNEWKYAYILLWMFPICYESFSWACYIAWYFLIRDEYMLDTNDLKLLFTLNSNHISTQMEF